MSIDVMTYNIHGLPWSKDNTEGICTFFMESSPSIICLQEVFLENTRRFYKEFLEMLGYKVCIPRDSGVTLLSSGLLVAVKLSEYHFISECFCCYQDVHNVERFANKGFHVVNLIQKCTKRQFYLVNTHMQSDTEVSWIFGRKVIAEIRRKQAMQIFRYFQTWMPNKHPVLLTGDLNCEKEPYEGILFLHPKGLHPLKKRTFYSTGEDLDHIACLTDRVEPETINCKIYDKPWSDHAPVRFKIKLN
jgi:exonuclease III